MPSCVSRGNRASTFVSQSTVATSNNNRLICSFRLRTRHVECYFLLFAKVVRKNSPDILKIRYVLLLYRDLVILVKGRVSESTSGVGSCIEGTFPLWTPGLTVDLLSIQRVGRLRPDVERFSSTGHAEFLHRDQNSNRLRLSTGNPYPPLPAVLIR